MGFDNNNDNDNNDVPDVGPVVSAPYSNDTTSKAAAEKILPYVRGQRREIVLLLRERDEGGATDEEQQLALNMKSQSQCPRRIELEEMGIVINSGQTRPTTQENDAIVWILNPKPDLDRVRKWLADRKKAKDVVIGARDLEDAKRIKKAKSSWSVRGPLGLRIFIAAGNPLLENLVNVLETDPDPDDSTRQFTAALREVQERVHNALFGEEEETGVSSLADELL